MEDLQLIAFLVRIDRLRVRTDEFKQVCHDNTATPYVHRFKIVLLVNNYFRSSVQSRCDSRGKFPLDVYDLFFNLIHISRYLVLKGLQLKRSQRTLVVNTVGDKVVQILGGLRTTNRVRVHNVSCLSGESEVANLARAVFVDKNICGLQISVYDT